MMRKILVFILLTFGHTLYAQDNSIIDDDNSVYAVVKDTDGYINIRKAPSTHSPVIDKIPNYNIVICEPGNSNWWKVEVIKHNNKNQEYFLDGYVYKTQLILLNKWKTGNSKRFDSNNFTFKADSFIVKLNSSAFNVAKYKFSKKNQITYFENGKHVWGTDGEIPKKIITSVSISKNGQPIVLPYAAFKDLCEPHFENIGLIHGPDNTIFIKMDNSDGAGAYAVIWIFKNDKYLGRYIDDSGD